MPYAINTVANNIFPAREPISAIAGATKPIIIRGMINPSNSLKMALKVTNIRATASGNINPAPIPSIMAISMRVSRLILGSFISENDCFY